MKPKEVFLLKPRKMYVNFCSFRMNSVFWKKPIVQSVFVLSWDYIFLNRYLVFLSGQKTVLKFDSFYILLDL